MSLTYVRNDRSAGLYGLPGKAVKLHMRLATSPLPNLALHSLQPFLRCTEIENIMERYIER